MGDRRMASRKIVESAKFLKMPATSQNLYFHLLINADDDGIVEAYPVLSLTKASEDDLRVLVSKGFIFLLNEDLVTYIEHWREQNLLRADRKRDSLYKQLIMELRPDVKLLERKERSDKRKSKIAGLTVDCPETVNGRYNISQSNLIEDNLSEDRLSINRHRDIEKCREEIADNIGLEILYSMAKNDKSETNMITELYETICDMVCYQRKVVVIKGVEYEWERIKQQFLSLRRVHIANVLNRIVNSDLNIKNMSSYLITTLYTESMSGTISEQAELYDDYLRSLRGKRYS